MPTAKFRPVFTEEQLRYLLSIAQEKQTESRLAKSCVSALSLFIFKIESQITKPSHLTMPVKTLDTVSLGFSEDTESETIGMSSVDDLVLKYHRDASSLTLLELDKIAAYRWSNDLMSPEEVMEYENSLNQIAKGA